MPQPGGGDYLAIRSMSKSMSGQSSQHHPSGGAATGAIARRGVAGQDKRTQARSRPARVPEQQAHYVPGLAATYGGAPGAPSQDASSVPQASSGQQAADYGLGHRALPDQHAHRAVGGEVEAGYGIGSRSVAEPGGVVGSASFSQPGAEERTFGKRSGNPPRGVGGGKGHGRQKAQWTDTTDARTLLGGDGTWEDGAFPRDVVLKKRQGSRESSRQGRRSPSSPAAEAEASAAQLAEAGGLWLNSSEPVRTTYGRRKGEMTGDDTAGGAAGASKCLNMTGYDPSFQGRTHSREARVPLRQPRAGPAADNDNFPGWHNAGSAAVPGHGGGIQRASSQWQSDSTKGMGGILTGEWHGDGSRGIIAQTGHSINPGVHLGSTKGGGQRMPLQQRAQAHEAYAAAEDAAYQNRRKQTGGAKIF